MRPRVFPAENTARGTKFESMADSSMRFNEAAGIPRGKRQGVPPTTRRSDWAKLCFNEAAGIPRGKQV